jgi:hypothetical protein
MVFGFTLSLTNYADVVKLVYTLDLGSSVARRESSSLSIRTIFFFCFNF